MNCPECGKTSKVISQTRTPEGQRRYHRCNHCGTKCISLDHQVVHVGDRRQGSSHFRSKLNEEKVIEIRKRHHQGESCFELGLDFDVDAKTISKAIRRQTWAHVA